MIILSAGKFNQMMSSITLVQLIDANQVQAWCSYIVKSIFELVQKTEVEIKMTAEQLGILL